MDLNEVMLLVTEEENKMLNSQETHLLSYLKNSNMASRSPQILPTNQIEVYERSNDVLPPDKTEDDSAEQS